MAAEEMIFILYDSNFLNIPEGSRVKILEVGARSAWASQQEYLEEKMGTVRLLAESSKITIWIKLDDPVPPENQISRGLIDSTDNLIRISPQKLEVFDAPNHNY